MADDVESGLVTVVQYDNFLYRMGPIESALERVRGKSSCDSHTVVFMAVLTYTSSVQLRYHTGQRIAGSMVQICGARQGDGVGQPGA